MFQADYSISENYNSFSNNIKNFNHHFPLHIRIHKIEIFDREISVSIIFVAF